MAKFTKTEIIQRISDQIGFSNNQSSNVVETLLEILKRSMDSGEDVLKLGFDKYVVQERPPKRQESGSGSE